MRFVDHWSFEINVRTYKAARTDANLQKIVDDHNVQSREFLDYTRVIKYGACNISDPNATKNSQNQPKNTQKPSDITYLLLTDSFVFFTKTHHENKVIMKHPSYAMVHDSWNTLVIGIYCYFRLFMNIQFTHKKITNKKHFISFHSKVFT